MQKYNFYSKIFIEKLVIFVFFLLLIGLGFWQVLRSIEKEKYISNIILSLNEPPTADFDVENLKIYDFVKISGYIHSSDILWLYRRHPLAKNQDGAYLIVKLKASNLRLPSKQSSSIALTREVLSDLEQKTESKPIFARENSDNVTQDTFSREVELPERANQEFAVVIGWVLTKNMHNLLEEIKNGKSVELSGLIMPKESSSLLIPRNNFEKKICFTLDMTEISSYFDMELVDYFISALDASHQFDTKMLPITPNMMINIKNNHIAYAAMWFSLAGVLAYIFTFTKKT
ncbi:MAG: SURF1 family cytochrome oxidase biogenesis protein [Rickettsiaceae bacterium]|nr:SURF1 family cytochrome oxidase biogenesis protein [Rickettsiaceae bacterium]